MKRISLAIVMLTFFLVGFASVAFAAGPDPFEGLKITPPDESFSPEVRALFGKSGKWGDKDGKDGIWHNYFLTRIGSSREPGYLVVLNLSETEAEIKVGYGKVSFIGKASVAREEGRVCLKTSGNLISAEAALQFCLEPSSEKMRGEMWGKTTQYVISLAPLEN